MKWYQPFTFILLITLMLSACDIVRPVYPATFTPPAPSATNRIVTIPATFTSPARPTQATATLRPTGLTSAWVVNTLDRTVIGIDPGTRQIVETIKIGGIPMDVVSGEGGVWVIESIDAEHSNLLRIDPYSWQVSAQIPIISGEAMTVTTGNGFVWVSVAKEFGINPAASGGVEFSRSGVILRIDPNPSQIIDSYDIPAMASEFFLEDEILWLLGKRNTYSILNKLDLTNRNVSSVPEAGVTPAEANNFDQFVKLGFWLWMTPQDTRAPYILRVNSSSGNINGNIQLGKSSQDSAAQLAVDGTHVWAALRSGRVVKIDPSTLKVVKSIPTGAQHLSGIFYASGYMWAVSQAESLAFQIDTLSEEVIAEYSTGSIPPPTVTPTITETPNPDLIWALCNDAYQTRLQGQEYARVNTDPPIPNRIRVEPGSNAEILGYVEPGDVVQIVAGPVCEAGWVWWKVTSISSGLTGWTSEGDGVDYWLVPYEL